MCCRATAWSVFLLTCAVPSRMNNQEVMTPRTRLESFQLQMRTDPALARAPSAAFAPAASAEASTSAPLAVPPIRMSELGKEQSQGSITMPIWQSIGNHAPTNGSLTDRPSSRRLTKDVLCADSQRQDASRAAGHVTLRDELGTPRSVRVVQQEERENLNMVSIKWLWSLDQKTYQVELRHGRLSGIRKVYVDKELIERVKTVSNAIFSAGSTHSFSVAGKRADVHIVPGKSAGFKYFLEIEGEPIEREIGIKAPGLSTEVGTHFVRLSKTADEAGFGMTLSNCGMRRDGVVIVALEPEMPATKGGLCVGDILLSVNETMAIDTNVILEKLTAETGEVMLEVAGSSPSRLIQVSNPYLSGGGGSLNLADTSCGIGVYVSAVEKVTGGRTAFAGELARGDVVLSVDGAVTESARETLKYLKRGPPMVSFVVAGRALAGP